MRVAALFLLLSMLSVCAEDWTTSSGTTYHDIKVVEVKDGVVAIRDSDGGAMIVIEKLPAEIQKSLGYDPANVQKQKAEEEAKKQQALQNAVYVFGILSEKTSDGLLVACPPGYMVVPGRETVTIDRQVPGKPPPVYGMCFLKNYPNADQLVDGSKVEITAYPTDPYSYQAVDGSTKTIPCYEAQTP